MLVHASLLVVGLALLIAGGEGLVRGAALLAARAGVSPIIVGLTVVAFGTSTPELAVSVFAAMAGNPDIAFGNVIGSNIANVALLLGITALVRPVAVHGQVILREIPMMILASATALVLGLDAVLDGQPGRYSRGDGAVLLLLFTVFLYYTVGDTLRSRRKDALVEEAVGEVPTSPAGAGIAVALVMVGGGLAGLVVGGKLAVDAAVGIARWLAVPEAAIGATVVAVGTSLPELVTCIAAARKGMYDLAMGNVVGSNIFNLLFVLGLTATLAPVAVPAGGAIDLAVMNAVAILLLPLALTHARTVTRAEGIVLLACYAGFCGWQAYR